MCATTGLSRLGERAITRKLPGLTPTAMLAYVFEALAVLLSGRPHRLAKKAVGCAHLQMIRLRGGLLSRRLRGSHYDLLLCESNLDSGLFLRDRIADVQVLDLPAPLAEELHFGAVLDEAGLARLRELEREIYAAADHLAFHWHTYADYVRTVKYDGPNFLDLGYGAPTPTTSARAQSREPARIAFLGYLQGYWVNLPLLEQLCALYPHIDIYGGPPPSGPLAAHYKGYSPDTATASGKDVLANYQFGLVTITDDELRRHSFSSKHLDYISYGLPVLTPGWRQDSRLEASSVYYTPDTFLSQIERYSREEHWRAKSVAALATAQQLSWDRVLSPLLDLKPEHGH